MNNDFGQFDLTVLRDWQSNNWRGHGEDKHHSRAFCVQIGLNACATYVAKVQRDASFSSMHPEWLFGRPNAYSKPQSFN